VRQFWPTADRVKATVELRCVFLERDERILPEMGVRVVFTAAAAADEKPVEVLVPARALVEGGAAVFLYDAGHAVKRVAQVGAPRADGLAPVASGLTGNELVILDPPAGLQDGDPVRRKEE
jgi:hypothetical protein